MDDAGIFDNFGRDLLVGGVFAAVLAGGLLYGTTEETYTKRIDVPMEITMVNGGSRCVTWLLPENYKGVYVDTNRGSYSLRYSMPTKMFGGTSSLLKNGVVDYQFVKGCN